MTTFPTPLSLLRAREYAYVYVVLETLDGMKGVKRVPSYKVLGQERITLALDLDITPLGMDNLPVDFERNLETRVYEYRRMTDLTPGEHPDTPVAIYLEVEDG